MISKISMAALAGAMFVSTAAYAAHDADAVKATIRGALAAANKGDSATFMADTTPQASVIDEFAPFHWDSFADWGAAYANYNTQNTVTHPKTDVRKFLHVNVDGDRAYAVVTVAYSYAEGGRKRSEAGTEVYSLEKDAGHWRVASFAWCSKAGVDQGSEATAVDSAVHAPLPAAGTSSPSPSAIVDEFAPYHWTGANANADWNAGLQKGLAAEHATDFAVKFGAPDQLSVNGDKAYAVYPTVLTHKEHGKSKSERGMLAFALDKSDGAWHVTSWAWATL